MTATSPNDLQERFYAARRDFRAWHKKQKFVDPEIAALAKFTALDIEAMDCGGNQSAPYVQAALKNALALEAALKKSTISRG